MYYSHHEEGILYFRDLTTSLKTTKYSTVQYCTNFDTVLQKFVNEF